MKENFKKIFKQSIIDNCLYIPDEKCEKYSFDFEGYRIFIDLFSPGGDMYTGTISKGN